MKESGWMLHLLLLCAAYPAVRAACPRLEGYPGAFKARIHWAYDADDDMCIGSMEGGGPPTSIAGGETNSIAGLGNDCLRFTCGDAPSGEKELFLNKNQSACVMGDGCSKDREFSRDSCSVGYICRYGVYNKTEGTNNGGSHKSGQFNVFSEYKCENAESGVCSPEECFNDSSEETDSDVCKAVGETVTQPAFGSVAFIFRCKRVQDRCNNQIEYIDWEFERTTTIGTPAPAGLDSLFGGPETEVTASPVDPITESPVTPVDPETESPVTPVDPETESPVTPVDPETESPVTPVDPETESPVTPVDPETESPVTPVPPTTSVVPAPLPAALDTTKCRPSKRTCKFSDNTQGCKYRRQCYPVNTSISWDDCTQFQCHGSADGSRGSDFPRSTWLPRFIGCYGPSGCVTFGQQVRDAETNALYTCTYTMGELGFPVPEFRRAIEEGEQGQRDEEEEEEEEDMVVP